jgi:predicted nucleic acid-binding Zn ribbon protein
MDRVGKLLSSMRLPGVSLSPEQLVGAAWPQAVGKRIAGRARAAALAGSTLIVEVDDEIWQRQLTALAGQILGRLRQVLGREIVTRLEFRLETPRRLPQRAATAVGDDAEAIADAGLRMAYRSSRRKSRA